MGLDWKNITIVVLISLLALHFITNLFLAAKRVFPQSLVYISLTVITQLFVQFFNLTNRFCCGLAPLLLETVFFYWKGNIITFAVEQKP